MLCSEFDPNPHAIINPEDLIQPIPGFPEICVMVFSNHIAEMCLRRWGGEHIAQVKCCVGDMPIYRVIVDGTEVALSTPYVGGPAAASFIEEVWPLGGKYFVFFGAAGVLDAVEKKLGIVPGGSTKDGLFSLDACRCIGACGLAPVMMINEDVYGRLTPAQVGPILDQYIKKG